MAGNIIDGVSNIVNQYGRVIVLEDDLVLSDNFLEYMNEALSVYENNEKVMHISAYMYPIDSDKLPDTFFLRTTSCWGWATWSRAWKYFDKNPEKCLIQFDRKMIKSINFDNSKDLWAQVIGNKNGTMNTWAIFWYTSVFLNEGLCLHPRDSLVQNIGHDGSGVDCGVSDRYNVTLKDGSIKLSSEKIEESTEATERLIQYYLKLRKPFSKRIIEFSKRKVRLIYSGFRLL
jgi:hypothetical protein